MKIQITLSILLAAALLGGCKNSTVVQSSDDLGTLRGKVAVFVNCDALSNASGATVHIEGTGFSATTDSLGEWTMNNVPAGIYNILITKPGFDTDLIAQDQFSGAGTQFLENGMISSTSPLLDSVRISSVQITKSDSIQSYRMDSVRQNPYDTIWWNVYDTVGYEYSLNITFTMNGPDSAISFEAKLTDVTRPGAIEFGGNDGFIQTQPISRNGSFVGNVVWISPTGIDGQRYPQPGDSIVVKTIPLSSCEGRSADTLSKAFVLP